MESDSDLVLSAYMRELIDFDYPQFSLLNNRRFENFLRARGLRVSQEDLEHFEKIGFLYPVLRLNRPKIIEAGERQGYAGINENAYMLKRYLKEGILEFPSPENFRPWKEYRDGCHEKTFIYYHPYQIILVNKFLNLSSFLLTSRFLENTIDFEKPFTSMKEFHDKFKKAFLEARPGLVRKIGFLLQLQNAYQPICQKRFYPNPLDNESYEKWYRWKKEKFSPEDVLTKNGFSINDVRDWRDYLSVFAISNDPGGKWYPLIYLVSFHKKEQLKGKALLAQDYYEMVGILNCFLKDLTGEKQPEPDDIVDGRGGAWKDDYYGKKFDKEDPEIQRKIIEEYLSIPRSKVMVLVEGDTEEISITVLAEAMGIPLERVGIRIHNFEGTGGITVQNAGALLQVIKAEGTGGYLIIDNDENAKELVNELLRRDLLKENCYRIWNTEFEEDNFGRELVLKAVNERLHSFGFNGIESEKIDEEIRLGRKRLMKAISDLIWKEYQLDIHQYISKKELGRILSSGRAAEIRHEISENKYEPKWEIERELTKIYEIFCC